VLRIKWFHGLGSDFFENYSCYML